MLETYDVRLRQRGQITVPREVRDRLSMNEGDTLTLVQVGSTLLLTPKRPVVPLLADRIVELMEEKGVTLADLLIGLEEERAAIYEERWSQGEFVQAIRAFIAEGLSQPAEAPTEQPDGGGEQGRNHPVRLMHTIARCGSVGDRPQHRGKFG